MEPKTACVSAKDMAQFPLVKCSSLSSFKGIVILSDNDGAEDRVGSASRRHTRRQLKFQRAILHCHDDNICTHAQMTMGGQIQSMHARVVRMYP